MNFHINSPETIQGLNNYCKEHSRLITATNELIEYVLDNTYDTNRDSVSGMINALISQCYIIPFTKTIYYIPNDNVLMPFSRQNFANAIKNKKPSFNSGKACQIFYVLMQQYYENNLVDSLIKRFSHIHPQVYATLNSPIFFKYDHSILLNPYFLQNQHGNFTPMLTKKTLNFFLSQILHIFYHYKIPTALLHELWKHSNYVEFATDSFENIILTPDCRSTLVDFNTGIVQIYPNNAQQSFPPFLKKYPCSLEEGVYSFGELEKQILFILLGSEATNLDYISSLIVAAYTNGKSLRVPTVFFSPSATALTRVKSILQKLFAKEELATLTDSECAAPAEHLETISAKIFGDSPVLLIDSPNKLVSTENIETFSKCKLIHKGPLVVRNRVPVIIFTTSQTLCNKLKNELKANIVTVEPVEPLWFEFEETLNHAGFNNIRQSLLAYGIKKSSTKEKNKAKVQTPYKKTLIERFADEYIDYSTTQFTAKSEIELYFKKYMDFVLKNSDEKIKYTKIEISKYLESQGKIKRKKRITTKENPVKVFLNTRIKKEAFDAFVKPIEDSEHPYSQNATTAKMMLDLEQSRLDMIAPPPLILGRQEDSPVSETIESAPKSVEVDTAVSDTCPVETVTPSTTDKQILNITNGEYFNEYLLSKTHETAVAFNEVMMDGDTTPLIYSDEFIMMRANVLNISPDEYNAKIQVYNELTQNTYSELRLWFGRDTFCQMNLLTLLAFLEQIDFKGEVTLIRFSDEDIYTIHSFEPANLGIYKKLYEDILIHKRMPDNVGVLTSKAIDLYFDYISENGVLATLVKQNAGMDENELVKLLLENSKDYGLSDLQAKKLIEANS